MSLALPLSIMLLRCIHFVMRIHSLSLLLLSSIPSCGHTVSLFIHQLMEHLGRVQFLAIMNKAAMNFHVEIFAWTYVFISIPSIFT